ncbi:MAG TPA: O-antigen polymerase [Polyangiaceae bacterium LLY-WYZ-15_(1-7)]|nr:O-antigen polymerase [Polyangiaceae bacterium LLY-WYZ-15_(1-7)]HJL06153.1 O-antigen polymerase [Polyangiaceae bacterium LLY-WYZ-15_(1-7)]HJL11798.1 O-antigen polymerase [Polyangiaceae bacterium LLY-WYZ-15_(1-7)]HJL33539.1 O-antigen polymerase [Polyangiaceae bacterium LLY-WYZ-15_(1-7)]HJL34417.1 O-antigen polymerase [Polyangiaceae bacterium LLY-WYZ-15_(1-7)]
MARGAVLALFLGYYVVVVFLCYRNQVPNGASILLALGLNLLTFALPLMFYRQGWGWFHPLVFASLWRVMKMLPRKLPTFVHGLTWHRALPEYSPSELNQLVAQDLLLEALGVLCAFVAFMAMPRPPVPSLRLALPRRHTGIWVAMAFAGGVVTLYLIARGGLLSHFSQTARSRHVGLAGQIYITRLVAFGFVALWYWLAYWRNSARDLRFWVAALIFAFLSFALTGSRGSIVSIAMVGLVVVFMRDRRIRVGRVALAAFAAIYVIGVLGPLRRSAFRDGEFSLENVRSVDLDEGLEGGGDEIVTRANNNNATLAILARVPERVDLLYGSSYVALFTAPIPRALWAGKPGFTGGRVGKAFYGTTGGVPPGAVGEAYWNFHIPGIVLVFCLFGAFQRWIADTVAAYDAHPSLIPMYAMCLTMFQSPVVMGFVYLVSHIVIALIVVWSMGTLGHRGPRT